MGKKKGKTIEYHITDEQIYYIQNHTLNFLYGRTIYWLYSDRMSLYYPFLMDKKKSRIPLEELLRYCRNQKIPVYPMTLRNGKLRTRIANWIEMAKMNNIGLLLKSTGLMRLINEYAKYCIAKYPIHIGIK